jgi:hypothetical protein
MMMWSVVFTLLVLVVIGGALWLWGTDEMERAAEVAEKEAETPVVEERVASRFESPTREAALDLVKRALQVREPGKVAEFFRVGSASPEAVVNFLRDMEQVDSKVTDYVWLSSMDANGLLLDGVAVNTGNSCSRLAILTPDEKGRWRVDFDAFARTATPAWSELMASGQGTARVVFVKDNYFNGPFKDEALWTCYRLSCPEVEKDLLGYCRSDSPQAAAMRRMLAHEKAPTSGTSSNRATLEIRRVEGADSRQFEITRVLAEDWVTSATPFDEQHQ